MVKNFMAFVIAMVALTFSASATFQVLQAIGKPILNKVIGRDTQCKALCAPALCKLSGKDSKVVKAFGKSLPNDRVVSWCKGMCQTVENVKGGFEIKKRYGNGWSLQACVEAGQEAGYSVPKGKLKSIAVYNEDDYHIVMGLLKEGSKENLSKVIEKIKSGAFGPQ